MFDISKTSCKNLFRDSDFQPLITFYIGDTMRNASIHVAKRHGNVRIVHVANHKQCWLYDTCILDYNMDTQTVQLWTKGYYTATTKRWLNMLLEQLTIPLQVYSRFGDWLLNDYHNEYNYEFYDGITFIFDFDINQWSLYDVTTDQNARETAI